MTTNRFVLRVATESAAIVLALALVVAAVGGLRAGTGVLVGGGLAVLNFWWLAGRATAAWTAARERGGRPLWVLPAALRFAACTAVCGVLFAWGWVHPVALLAGLTVLPCELVVQGLRAAREPS